jgi:YD repeat-containing protein
MPIGSKKNNLRYVLASLTLFHSVFFSAPGYAQEATIESEQAKLIRAPNSVATLGPDLFGDTVSLYHGALEFSQTDVSLPGNNKLPVAVGRRLVTGGLGNGGRGLFAHWDLDIPRIYGVFSILDGWRKVNASGQPSTARCTNFGDPPPVYKSGTSGAKYRPAEFWHGNMLYVPGTGSQEILRRNTAANTNVPSDGIATPLVTKSLWAIRCLPALVSTNAATPANDAGEGFLAISPDGTQYRFDWLVSRPMERIYKLIPNAKFSLDRIEVSIFPTLVTDRFGNTVRYTYDSVDKWKLLNIKSSDGVGAGERSMTFTYIPSSRLIQSVTDGMRTWTYNYVNGTSGMQLSSVVLPDNSAWNLTGLDGTYMKSFLVMDLESFPPESGSYDCDQQPVVNSLPITGSMVHPSGAVGTFTLSPTQHGRNGVPEFCYSDGLINTPGRAYSSRFFDMYSLTNKTITGPGLTPMTWNTTYDTLYPGWKCPECGESSPSVVNVTNPKGEVTRYSFGNTFNVDEGLPKQVDVGWNGTSALQTTVQRYNTSFTEPVGFSDQPRGDNLLNARHVPLNERVITQQGVEFKWTVAANQDFDEFRRPRKVTRSSSIGIPKTETTDYHDNLTRWVLGQISKVTDSGTSKVIIQNDYNATTALLESVRRFGNVEATFSYHPDGTLYITRDGKGQGTLYTNYQRGIPRNAAYPDGTSESVMVNDIGRIAARTDQTNFTTVYRYDVMGRVAEIVYPVGGPAAWNATIASFTQVPHSEYGLDPGHWRQTVSTGSRTDTTVFDALWRPVFSEKFDSTNVAATYRIIKKDFDFNGNVTFTSFPQSTMEALAGGVHVEYDALARPTVTGTDSEHGIIYSGNSYGPNFSKVSTDGRGIDTVFNFQAFDTPSESAVTSIVSAEGVQVNIARDIFGKALAVSRSGGGKSATRSYVYDEKERLCKTIEPETGATLVDYDLANNVIWRASGLSLPSASCDTLSVVSSKKIGYGYDALNRLKNTTYGDLSPDVTRTYTPDGLLETINSNGANWTYSYNPRRLSIAESLSFGGVTYTLSKSYDANGSLSLLNYPDNTSISYSPNALGEPTTVGSHASAIAYHPNGAIKGFTYGNGLTHSLTQNVRGLPERSIDSGVLNDVYAYDKNANVTSILDWPEGVSNRAMEYDGLNRLKRVYAPAIWGDALYSYDALDNLTSSQLTGGLGIARTMLHNYDSVNRLASVTGTTNFSVNYGYDSQGNITQRGSQAYVFDMGNRMRQASGLATYGYDGFGRRTSVIGTDGVTRLQMYSSDGKLVFAGPTTLGKR